MEKINFECSTKNIPIPPSRDYLTRLIELTEKLIRIMRWRAYHFLNPSVPGERKGTFGKNPPQVPELSEFEDRIAAMIQRIEFRIPAPPKFQISLSKHIDTVKKSSEIFVPADKTTNNYKMPPEHYKAILQKNIEKEYAKAPTDLEQCINSKAKDIALNLQIDNRVETLTHKDAFVSLKDHKDNFQNYPTCCLINPTKSELGKVSKQILDKINTALIDKTVLTNGRTQRAALTWFINIPNKTKHS